MKLRLARGIVAAVLLAITMAPIASADGLTATLDGKRIRMQRVASLQCHDFDYPIIRCFSTPDLIAADIAARFDANQSTGARLLLTGWVTVYENADYGTPSISMANDYPSLSALGWNDRISSFKSFGATGNFWEHSPSGGFDYTFASTTQASSLGSNNDKFSAFNIN